MRERSWNDYLSKTNEYRCYSIQNGFFLSLSQLFVISEHTLIEGNKKTKKKRFKIYLIYSMGVVDYYRTKKSFSSQNYFSFDLNFLVFFNSFITLTNIDHIRNSDHQLISYRRRYTEWITFITFYHQKYTLYLNAILTDIRSYLVQFHCGNACELITSSL